MTKLEQDFLNKEESKAIKRIVRSASGYVLVKRFSTRGRAGLKEAIAKGRVKIIETLFGNAYTLV